VKLAITLDLTLQPFEQIAFEFHNFSASQAGHVDVIALRPSLVIMLFSLHVHEIKLIHQTMPLEQAEGTVDGHAVNVRIDALCVTQDLAGIEMLLGSLDHAKNGASLPSHAEATRHEFRLQASRSFCLWQRHSGLLDIELQLYPRQKQGSQILFAFADSQRVERRTL
jgi:hypothetical protein